MVFLGILVDIPYKNYSSIAANDSSLFSNIPIICYNRYVLKKHNYYMLL